MSEQEPTSPQPASGTTPPPVPPGPVFSPYQAPAYGDVAPEPPRSPAPGSGTPYLAPQPQPFQVAPQYLAHPAAPTHPLAITSLVLGLVGLGGLMLAPAVGFTLVLSVCSPFAIGLGVRARRQIRQQPMLHGGEGLASAGFWLGIVGTVLAVVGLLLVLAIVVFVVSLFAGS